MKDNIVRSVAIWAQAILAQALQAWASVTCAFCWQFELGHIILGYSILRMFNYIIINTQTHSHTATQPHRHTNTQTHGHTDTQTHRHTSTQAHRHTAAQANRHTDTQTHRHTDSQTHRHTATQTHSNRQTAAATMYETINAKLTLGTPIIYVYVASGRAALREEKGRQQQQGAIA